VIRDQSHGMWRRVKLVPFGQTFDRPDRTLSATLAAEAPGILSWAVRGCLEWQRDGLRHPEVVETATENYQKESDPLTEFIDEECVVAANAFVGGKALFEAYQRWCRDRQMPELDRLSQKAFGTRIRTLYRADDGRTVTYRGIRLRGRGSEM
jgi:putative DNA primase/helicase